MADCDIRYPHRCTVALAILALVCAAEAQTVRSKANGGCREGTDYEAEHYFIRDARIEDMWAFLRSLNVKADAADKAATALKGQAYKNAAIRRVQDIITAERFLPTDINYAVASVENCMEKDKQLSVVFRIFSVQVSPVLSSTFEFRQDEKEVPGQAVGVTKESRYWSTAPKIGYNHTEKLFAGGTFQAYLAPTRFPIRSVMVDGYGSSSAHSISFAADGAFDSTTGLVGHAEWRLDFRNFLVPTGAASLSGGRMALQFLAESHPLRMGTLRAGVTAEGGSQQSGFLATQLDPRTLARAPYSSLKFYGGLTGNHRSQAFQIAYGLELGSTDSSFHGDWRKHLADVAHDGWWEIGDHRLFEIEQRGTLGALQVLRDIPVGARFFGGNREEHFIYGDTWQLRSAPFIRSIPAYRLSMTSAGAGADRFLSYNLTLALTAWRKPLVPPELGNDSEFKEKLEGALTSSTNILQVAYTSQDPHFLQILSILPELQTKLEALKQAVSGATANSPSSLQDTIQNCTDAIGSSLSLVKHARKDKPVQAFGSVQELLPDGIGALADTVAGCGTNLNGQIHDPAVAAASNAVDALNKQIQQLLGSIDQNAATAKANADMSYVRRTIDVILNQMNITSVSPVGIFDVAHIGPAANIPYSGTRYGVGGGLRFTLVSTVSFTGGYAWSPVRRQGEGAGAFFFSLTTRNLFR
ncbi:MAG TPA: hypothetical protein VJA94_08335 [Candidatus Angelobacter sp.]